MDWPQTEPSLRMVLQGFKGSVQLPLGVREGQRCREASQRKRDDFVSH